MVEQEKLIALEKEKNDAVSNEDYARAAQLKKEIDDVRAICSLESDKRAAIEAEDYAKAAEIKKKIDGLRQTVQIFFNILCDRL